jgi:hypothetical protein
MAQYAAKIWKKKYYVIRSLYTKARNHVKRIPKSTELRLNINVFWDVTMCHVMSNPDVLKDHHAFILTVNEEEGSEIL